MISRRKVLLAGSVVMWQSLAACRKAPGFRCGHPYSAEELEALLRRGEPEHLMRERVRSCGIFALRPDSGLWLKRCGASDDLAGFLQNQRPRGETLAIVTMQGSTTIGQAARPDGGRSLAEDLVRGWLVSVEKSTVPHASSDGQTTYVSAVMPDGCLQRIAILALGTKYAFIGLRTNADIGLASRPILENEAAEFLRDGEDMRSAACEKILSLDAVAIVVSDNILATAMSRHQVRDIFRGAITNWSAISGSGSSDPIRVVARKQGAGTLDAFRESFMEFGGDRAGFTANAKYVDGSEDISEHMRTPGSIGFVSFVYSRNRGNPHAPRAVAISDVDVQPGGRLVPLQPVLPAEDTIGTECYPGSRRVYAYVRSRSRNARAVKLVEFSVSEDGQRIAAEHGFIPQTLRVLRSSERGVYADTIPNEQRLSINIHFRSNSNQLDSKAEADIERLVRYVGPLNRPKITVVLRGHADSYGSPAGNERLAMERCKTVHRTLAAVWPHNRIAVTSPSGDFASNHGSLTVASHGYGYQFPIASNQYELGRYRNRRVEVSLI